MKGKIKNFAELAMNKDRKTALLVMEAGLKAIDTATLMKKNFRLQKNALKIKEQKISLQSGGRILAVGVGKCSYKAAMVLENILGERLEGGVVVDTRVGDGLKKIRALQGDHPMPSEWNINAAGEIIAKLSGLKKEDLVIMIISGGGSTMLCQPQNLTCQEETKILSCLFKEGASIKEINTVRKHVSLARGGYLAQYAYPAKVVSLIFSDVPGNNLEFVASGPTFRDNTGIGEAKAVLKKYAVEEKSGISEIRLLETPKDEKYFSQVKNILFASNKLALSAMAREAERRGLSAKIVNETLVGEVRQTGAEILRELRQQDPKKVLLFGGETTVLVKGEGRGGRNQEMALALLPAVESEEMVITMASDGCDNTDSAGAICDIITRHKAEKKGMNSAEFLAQNNSYEFFKETGDFLLTGPTGSNVSDLIAAFKF